MGIIIFFIIAYTVYAYMTSNSSYKESQKDKEKRKKNYQKIVLQKCTQDNVPNKYSYDELKYHVKCTNDFEAPAISNERLQQAAQEIKEEIALEENKHCSEFQNINNNTDKTNCKNKSSSNSLKDDFFAEYGIEDLKIGI